MLDMMRTLRNAFRTCRTPHCCLHDRDCPQFPLLERDPESDKGSKPFLLHVAGPTCKDWSRRGKKHGLAGDHTVPFAIWMQQFLQSVPQPRLFLVCWSLVTASRAVEASMQCTAWFHCAHSQDSDAGIHEATDGTREDLVASSVYAEEGERPYDFVVFNLNPSTCGFPASLSVLQYMLHC